MFDDHYGLTQAVLDGSKDMTRRFCDVQYYAQSLGLTVPVRRVFLRDGIAYFEHYRGVDPIPVRQQPRYKIGEIVAVSECYDTILSRLSNNVAVERLKRTIAAYHHKSSYSEVLGAKNKMYVMSLFMRNYIRFVDLRVERLQDISGADCLREGIIQGTYCGKPYFTFYGSQEKDGTPVGYSSPIYAFSELINKMSGKHTWNVNRWNYVYTFKRILL